MTPFKLIGPINRSKAETFCAIKTFITSPTDKLSLEINIAGLRKSIKPFQVLFSFSTLLYFERYFILFRGNQTYLLWSKGSKCILFSLCTITFSCNYIGTIPLPYLGVVERQSLLNIQNKLIYFGHFTAVPLLVL